MAAPLADYPGMVLAIDCGQPRCLGLRMFAINSMVLAGNRLTVGEAMARMRCQKCGKPPGEAVLQSRAVEKPQRLVLIGPGAYG